MNQPPQDSESSIAPSVTPSGASGAGLFGAPRQERNGPPVMAWAVAGLLLLLAAGGVVAASRHKPGITSNAVQPLDPYATSLVVSDVVMSESVSLSGGKSTFLDGRVRNSGPRTVSAATMQVLFSNDEQLPPQVETLPLTVIRTREPYVDTQPVSAAPLKPGEEREFRLIFENIGSNWNQQVPQMRVVKVE